MCETTYINVFYFYQNTVKITAFNYLPEERSFSKAHAFTFQSKKSAYSNKIGILQLYPKEAALREFWFSWFLLL